MTNTDLTVPTTSATPTVTTESMALIENTAASLGHAHQIASALCTTAFAPPHFKGKPEEAAAAILYGAQIGLDPLAAMQNVYVISGRPALYARTMVAVVLAAGHRIWTEESTDERVTVSGQRRGSDVVETVTWTPERAKLAGYTSNKKYATDPQAMLYARAAGDVARRIAPDALLGLSYTVEEMQVVDAVDVTPRRQPLAYKSAAALLDEPATDPDPEPARPTEAQLRKMFKMLADVGAGDRASALAYVNDVLAYEGEDEITSRAQLTASEVSQVIDAAEEELQRQSAQADDNAHQGDLLDGGDPQQ